MEMQEVGGEEAEGQVVDDHYCDYDNPDGDLLPSHHHLNDIYEHDPDFSDGVCALLGDPWDPLCPHPHSRPTLQVRRGS